MTRNGSAVDAHQLADRIGVLAEQVLLQLVAEEDHAPALVEVELVRGSDRPPIGIMLRMRAEVDVRRPRPGPTASSCPSAMRAPSCTYSSLIASISSTSLRRRVDVLVGQLHPAAARQPLPGLAGARRPGDDDGVAQSLLADHHLLVQPLAEGQQQGHRGRAPDDAEDGQEEPQLLRADVARRTAAR